MKDNTTKENLAMPLRASLFSRLGEQVFDSVATRWFDKTVVTARLVNQSLEEYKKENV